MTYEDMTKSIYSPESEDGPSHSASQDGPTIDESGPAPVPVSRFRALVADRVKETSGTSGPLFNALSPSAALQRSLESKLQANLAGSGSLLFALTWSHWNMPSGLPISRLRVSGRRTSGSGYGGWPTPDVRNGGRSTASAERYGQTYVNPKTGKKLQWGLESAARLTGWPTPKVSSGTGAGVHGDGGLDLQTTAQLAGWATPRSTEAGHSTGSPERARDNKSRLEDQVMTTGEMSNGSPAPTERRGQLNPEFTRWLMGFPAEWAACAPTATRSSRR